MTLLFPITPASQLLAQIPTPTDAEYGGIVGIIGTIIGIALITYLRGRSAEDKQREDDINEGSIRSLVDFSIDLQRDFLARQQEVIQNVTNMTLELKKKDVEIEALRKERDTNRALYVALQESKEAVMRGYERTIFLLKRDTDTLREENFQLKQALEKERVLHQLTKDDAVRLTESLRRCQENEIEDEGLDPALD